MEGSFGWSPRSGLIRHDFGFSGDDAQKPVRCLPPLITLPVTESRPGSGWECRGDILKGRHEWPFQHRLAASHAPRCVGEHIDAEPAAPLDGGGRQRGA